MSEEQLSKDKASKGKKNKASGIAAMLNQKKAAATEKDAQESESVSESEGISGDERPTGNTPYCISLATRQITAAPRLGVNTVRQLEHIVESLAMRARAAPCYRL